MDSHRFPWSSSRAWLWGLTLALVTCLFPSSTAWAGEGAGYFEPSSPQHVQQGSLPYQVPTSAPIEPATPEDFWRFSWQGFIALQLPATLAKRGFPNESNDLGDRVAPRVWSTWKPLYELFPGKNRVLGEWESTEPRNPCERDDIQTGDTLLDSFDHLRHLNQPEGGPLVARNATYVHYEVKVNQRYFEAFRAKELYKKSPSRSEFQAPPGSMLAKAAWREVTPRDGTDPARYYITSAWVRGPGADKCVRKDMALVGFHFMYKPLSNNSEWIWSSFEHTDNLPAERDSQKPSSFQLGEASRQVDLPASLVRRPVQHPKPTEVVRHRHIDSRMQNITAEQWGESVRGTVWEHYQLVMTQWKQDRGQGTYYPADNSEYNRGNITLETYHQDKTCLACHNNPDTDDVQMFMHPPPHEPADAHSLSSSPNP